MVLLSSMTSTLIGLFDDPLTGFALLYTVPVHCSTALGDCARRHPYSAAYCVPWLPLPPPLTNG
jgi:hypothetical protein